MIAGVGFAQSFVNRAIHEVRHGAEGWVNHSFLTRRLGCTNLEAEMALWIAAEIGVLERRESDGRYRATPSTRPRPKGAK